MAQLVTCATYTKECPLCGRTTPQTTFCSEVTQAATTASGEYFMDSRELATHIN